MSRRHSSRADAKLTKKQVSRRRREQRQLRWIWISVGTVAFAVVAILAVGLILQSTRVVAEVNGRAIRIADYQQRVRFWYHYYNSLVMPGAFDQMEAAQREQFYRQILDQMVDELLVLQEAAKKGLSTSSEEVQTELEESWFQHYRVPRTPTPSPTVDPKASPTVESTPRPTATPDTEQAFQTRYQEFITKVLRPSGVSEDEFRQMVQASVLENKLKTALVPDVPSEEDQVRFRYTSVSDAAAGRAKIASLQSGSEEQVHAQHILVDKQEDAESTIKRLQAGEDFATLAAELSKDSSNKDKGGDLDWFGRGQMVAEFDKVVFEADLGLYPSPVQTKFGFHVIKILGRENRPVDREKELFDAGWYGREQMATQFGAVLAEALFASPVGLVPEPIPTEFGTVVAELLDHQVRTLDEEERESRRSELFRERLAEIRQEADVKDLWKLDMVPSAM